MNSRHHTYSKPCPHYHHPQETARREEAARKELAWDTEKRRLAVAKLKKYFLDQVPGNLQLSVFLCHMNNVTDRGRKHPNCPTKSALEPCFASLSVPLL